MPFKASRLTKAWTWLKAHWWLPLSILIALVGLAVFIGTRGRGGSELLRVDKRLRESKAKADEEIRVLEEQTEAAIVQVETAHALQLEQLEQAQRAEYERVRRRGPGATAAWLNDFDREQFK